MRTIVSILILTLINSCSSQELQHEENVPLEYESGWQREFNTYYEVGSDKPYTGEFVCYYSKGKVIIDFREGKMDGDFVRFNTDGDTTEYIRYNNGRLKYRLEFQYDNGNVIHRGEHIVTKGSVDDKQIFDKVSNLMVSGDYKSLNNFLNTFGDYKSELNSLKQHFGNLNSIEIIEIENQYDSYNERADIRAKMILKYDDIQLRINFLVVKYDTGELKGQGISYKPVTQELIKDEKVPEILAELDVAPTGYEYLDTDVWPDENMIFIKNYLVEIEGKKQVLNIWYMNDSNNKMAFNIFHITPHRRAFQGMHWN